MKLFKKLVVGKVISKCQVAYYEYARDIFPSKWVNTLCVQYGLFLYTVKVTTAEYNAINFCDEYPIRISRKDWKFVNANKSKP